MSIYYVPRAALQKLLSAANGRVDRSHKPYPVTPASSTEFLISAQTRPRTSVHWCQPSSLEGRFVAAVRQCSALCTCVWRRCSHGLASLTFHNTSVLTCTPQPMRILSLCITCEKTGWKNYGLEGNYQSCLLQEGKCWEGRHVSKATFKTSSLRVYWRPPTATHTLQYSSHQCSYPTAATVNVVFTGSHQDWSRPEKASVLEALLK